MHIQIVSHGYPSRRDPQWGCFEKDQAEALVNQGHRVSVLVLDTRLRTYRRHRGVSHFKDGSIDVFILYVLPEKLIPTASLRISVKECLMYHLYRKAEETVGRPDVIYAHYMGCIAQMRLVKERSGIPVVGLEHWSELNNERMTPYLRKMGRIAYSISDKLLAVSPSLSRQMKKHFGVDSDVLPDMVNDVFLEQELKRRTADGRFHLVSMGSLIERKGFDLLLKAMAALHDPAVELDIIGAGPELQKLKQLSGELGLSDRVHFCGMLDKAGIIERFRSADAFVLASRGETFGVSYVEAMAMGLPVIATRCGGPEHFVTPECGLVVEVEDVDGLSAAIRTLKEGISSYDPEWIREYVSKNFSGRSISDKLFDVIDKLNRP